MMMKNLRGQQLLLRPLCEDDLSRRARWTGDRELMITMCGAAAEEMGQGSYEEELSSNREWFAGRRKSGVMPYAVEVNGVYIGDIDYDTYPEEKKAELTVFLGDRSAWGKGYGTEAVTLIIEEMFRGRRIEFIEVDVVPGNDRALAFWKQLGFTEHRTDAKGIIWLRRHRG